MPHTNWSSTSNQTLPNFCAFGFFMFNQETGRRLLRASQTLRPPAGGGHLRRLMVELVMSNNMKEVYIVIIILSGMTRMEEVYITGLLAEKAGLAHSDLAHLWTLNPIRLDFVSRKRFPENQPETCTGLCGPS